MNKLHITLYGKPGEGLVHLAQQALPEAIRYVCDLPGGDAMKTSTMAKFFKENSDKTIIVDTGNLFEYQSSTAVVEFSNALKALMNRALFIKSNCEQFDFNFTGRIVLITNALRSMNRALVDRTIACEKKDFDAVVANIKLYEIKNSIT